MQTDVIIVGAGAAGLMAARELAKTGKKVLILEARDRIGGRIYPLPEEEFGYGAQGGGEFVHGDAPITIDLLKEVGATLINPTEWWNVRDVEPVQQIERISPHNPLLERRLKELSKDISVSEFLSTYFGGAEYEALRDFVRRWVEGYDAADLERASSFTLREEMLNEGSWSQRSIRKGYGPLLKYLQTECEKNGVEIFLRKEVDALDFSAQDVQVHCKDGFVYTAPQTVLTVPLPIFSQITYTPPIPNKLKALKQIGFGGVIKILLRFKTKWWIDSSTNIFERLFFMLSAEFVPTWWTQYPEDRLVLTGWLPGPEARIAATRSDQELLEEALHSLSNIFKISVENIRKELILSKIVNWVTDPFAQGAYSYATPESADAIRELLNPIENKVFFAGEAINKSEVCGSVEGALSSGLRTAKTILSNI